ncbi:MAG: hypothetical protein VYA69_08940 [Gemmatimonadota bacterium]|nr:hypothetical protein [Gemmatimonadota bacterium]
MGRPSKFTEERRKAILENLESGVSREVASMVSGVEPETLPKLMRKSEESATGTYKQFANDAIQSEATAVINMVQVIHDASERDWHASGWWMERRRPEEWGRSQSREQVKPKD